MAGLGDDRDRRIRECLADLLKAAEEREITVTGDRRVGIGDGASLMGLKPESFRKAIKNPRAGWPRTYRIPVGDHKLSLKLDELAESIIRRGECH